MDEVIYALFNSSLLMLSFSTPPSHLKNSAASVAAPPSHHLVLDGVAEANAPLCSFGSSLCSLLHPQLYDVTLETQEALLCFQNNHGHVH